MATSGSRHEREKMACPRTPTRPPDLVLPSCQASPSPAKRSPLNPSNTYWVQQEQRKNFLHHLEQWSLCHDSSSYFHGNIRLVSHTQNPAELALATSVTCFLTDSYTKTTRRIIIRLFAPQPIYPTRKHLERRQRRQRRQRRCDSMDLTGSELNFSEWQRGFQRTASDSESMCSYAFRSETYTSHCYKLVVRCGAGWMSAREYFSKLYFTRLEAQKRCSRILKHCGNPSSKKSRSERIGRSPADESIVVVQPLFHPFRRLPAELQEMIFRTAAGHTRIYNLCYDQHLVSKSRRKEPSPIDLSTMFQISKAMNVHLIPYVFHSTDFVFGLTGFTNFLWQSGPTNRSELKRLTFHFGKLALLHCIRWLASDSIFEFLEPPVVTSPRSLQYFWRCQIQDLARELHLFSLTLNLQGIPPEDIPMVVCILKSAFGSIEHLRFVDVDKYGIGKTIELNAKTQTQVDRTDWRTMCLGYLKRHQSDHYFFKWTLWNHTREEYVKLMDELKGLFVEEEEEIPVTSAVQ